MIEIKSPFLEACTVDESYFFTGPFVMVIFGANGDLCKSKLMPDLYKLYLKKYIDVFSIICLDIEKKNKRRLQERNQRRYSNKFKK